MAYGEQVALAENRLVKRPIVNVRTCDRSDNNRTGLQTTSVAAAVSSTVIQTRVHIFASAKLEQVYRQACGLVSAPRYIKWYLFKYLQVRSSFRTDSGRSIMTLLLLLYDYYYFDSRKLTSAIIQDIIQ